jgi:hypothetical protein
MSTPAPIGTPKRFARWFLWNGPFVLIMVTCFVVCISVFWDLVVIGPTPAELRLCDSAVTALVAAQDQLSLDRAKFVIERERCGIAKRTDRVSSTLK